MSEEELRSVPSRGRAEAGPIFKAKIRRPGQGFGLRWLKRRKHKAVQFLYYGRGKLRHPIEFHRYDH